MNKKICKYCKYWLEKEISIPCEYAQICYNFTNCLCPDFLVGKENMTGKNQLAYDDHEGYMAKLTTGEEFGCIHFEEKEESNKDIK